jgi:hypothetical protein
MATRGEPCRAGEPEPTAVDATSEGGSARSAQLIPHGVLVVDLPHLYQPGMLEAEKYMASISNRRPVASNSLIGPIWVPEWVSRAATRSSCSVIPACELLAAGPDYVEESCPRSPPLYRRHR